MSAQLAQALKAATAAIYFADSSDYLPALWDVVRSLSPEIAELAERDVRAAWQEADALADAHEAAPQQEPVAVDAMADPEREVQPLYAAPQQAQAPGWQLSRVSDGDIRVYGPDKETWLIRKDCGEGFYDFIHRYFDAAIGAEPQQGSKT